MNAAPGTAKRAWSNIGTSIASKKTFSRKMITSGITSDTATKRGSARNWRSTRSPIARALCVVSTVILDHPQHDLFQSLPLNFDPFHIPTIGK